MKTASWLAASAVLLAAPLSAQPLRANATAAELAGELEPLVPRLMHDGDVPGVSLAVVRDGRVVFARAFGVREAGAAKPVPIDDATVFEAASLSKPVFAYAVMRLVDAKVLDLDTPISKYLPGDYAEDERIRLITPRHVLSHTTGFPNWRQDKKLETHFAPGERFSYSGEGFMYLQKAVERTTGEDLHALMQRLVFGPLAMTSSSYTWEERFEGRKSAGHDAFGAVRKANHPAEPESPGTLHTTRGDYARFLIAALGGRGLSRGAFAEMLRPQARVDEGCSNCVTEKPTGRLSKELAWGLGWGLQETADGTSIWHWGDNGGNGFHCFVVGYPREKLGMVVFTNGTGGHGIIPEIVGAAIGGRQPAFAWMGYEPWNSPARTYYKDVLARGAAAAGEPPALTEPQINDVGYWLLAKKRTKDAIAVFEKNVARFPGSWNAHDSLGEALAEDGQREKAIASYEKSVALNPENTNGLEQLARLRRTPK